MSSLFTRLAERAMEQTTMPHIEGFMRLALRAQSQCRATLETLGLPRKTLYDKLRRYGIDRQTYARGATRETSAVIGDLARIRCPCWTRASR